MNTQTPKRDLLDLLESNLRLREQLKSLEKDTNAWDRKGEIDDIESMAALIRKLEEDVSRAMSDFNAFHSGSDTPSLNEGFRHAFSIMNDLFEDLKKMKRELEQAYLGPEKLRRLETDWSKLKKTFGALEKQANADHESSRSSFF